ncbi:hypothetical protein AVEN_223097-1 [Araneus ventricosus]|uniref:Uncharacterized protein n=1 Tax=Araneus ventricosus TaxID=182803 RepID=A0A4Y2RDY9_ARAVE|nr:hypothetical protein AVEN_223097-1 [Araneus ventricosus]
MTRYIHSPSLKARLACSLDGRPVAARCKMAAMQEKSFCVLEYAKCSSVTSVQRAFLRKYGIAAPCYLYVEFKAGETSKVLFEDLLAENIFFRAVLEDWWNIREIVFEDLL